MSYYIRESGEYAGQPAVNLAFGEERGDSYTVDSIRAQMDGFDWTNKIRTNRTPLVFKGVKREGGGTPFDPCFSRYEQALWALDSVLRSNFTIVESMGIAAPPEKIQEAADFYTVRLSQHQIRKYHDENRDEWEWFANRARYEGDVEFILEPKNFRDEDYVTSLQQEYKIPEENIYIEPPGETIQEVNDEYFEIQEMCKRNQWQITPRIDLLEDGGLPNDE